MPDKYFNFGDVLGYGAKSMKENFWLFVGVGLVYIVLIYLPIITGLMVERVVFTDLMRHSLYWSVQIIGWVIQVVMAIGLVKIALSFCSEVRPKFSVLFDAHGCFWRFLGTNILYILIMYAGFLLLIVPGIIWAVKFSLAPYFVIDKGLGPIRALKASSQATMGLKWELFGFGLLTSLLNMAGLLCLILGIFVTYPIVLVAYALVYRQLAAQTPELAEFGIAPVACAVTEIQPSNEPGPESEYV